MNPSSLQLDRIEYSTVKVAAVEDYSAQTHEVFPQLDFDFDGLHVKAKSLLFYPDSEAHDPRHFIFEYGILIDPKESSASVPYSVEIEARAFMLYCGDQLSGADRFRAVRFSGYQIIYGAMREMVCNITSRSPHGLWMLPARNFNGLAAEKSKEDEVERLKMVERLGLPRRIAAPEEAAIVEHGPVEPARKAASAKKPRASKKQSG
jgi:hypothetical protein